MQVAKGDEGLTKSGAASQQQQEEQKDDMKGKKSESSSSSDSSSASFDEHDQFKRYDNVGLGQSSAIKIIAGQSSAVYKYALTDEWVFDKTKTLLQRQEIHHPKFLHEQKLPSPTASDLLHYENDSRTVRACDTAAKKVEALEEQNKMLRFRVTKYKALHREAKENFEIMEKACHHHSAKSALLR